MLLEKNENKQKEARVGPIKNKLKEHNFAHQNI